MLDIILHQSSFTWDKLSYIALFGVLPFFLGSLGIYFVCLLDEHQKRKQNKEVETNNLFFLALSTILGVLGLYLWIPINEQQKILQPLTEHKTTITQYYDFKKDGKTITAIKKEKAYNLFVSKLTVTIIDEDKQSYQVQYNNEYGRISKTDVK